MRQIVKIRNLKILNLFESCVICLLVETDVCCGLLQEDYYRPQTKFVKVMFLHVSVSHSVHRGACVARGVCMAGGVHGGMRAQGACVPGARMAGGACMARGRHVCHTHPPGLILQDMVGQ